MGPESFRWHVSGLLLFRAFGLVSDPPSGIFHADSGLPPLAVSETLQNSLHNFISVLSDLALPLHSSLSFKKHQGADVYSGSQTRLGSESLQRPQHFRRAFLCGLGASFLLSLHKAEKVWQRVLLVLKSSSLLNLRMTPISIVRQRRASTLATCHVSHCAAGDIDRDWGSLTQVTSARKRSEQPAASCS